MGKSCLEQGQVNAAANRLYYSVFQAVLYFSRNKRPGHEEVKGGVHTRMARVVKTHGKTAAHSGAIFEDLLALRETADYDKESPEKSDIESLLNDAEKIRKFHLDEAEK